MAPYLQRILTLVWAATLVVALPVMTPHADAQGFGRRPSGDSAQSDRSRGDTRGSRRGLGRAGRNQDGNSGRPASRGSGRGSASGGTASNSSTRSNSTSRTASDSERTREWARKLIQKHDKSGNMMLETAEQGDLGSSSRGADINSDGVITLDELVTHVSPKSTNASAKTAASTTAGTGASSSGTTGRSDRAPSNTSATSQSASTSQPSTRTYVGRSSSAKSDGASRKSYRFTPPTERLPSGLPSWFKSRDANGDGQIAMHEFSRSWNDRTAADFQRQDKNNDGFITPDEAVR